MCQGLGWYSNWIVMYLYFLYILKLFYSWKHYLYFRILSLKSNYFLRLYLPSKAEFSRIPTRQSKCKLLYCKQHMGFWLLVDWNRFNYRVWCLFFIDVYIFVKITSVSAWWLPNSCHKHEEIHNGFSSIS
jgi:hypothetical protein